MVFDEFEWADMQNDDRAMAEYWQQKAERDVEAWLDEGYDRGRDE